MTHSLHPSCSDRTLFHGFSAPLEAVARPRLQRPRTRTVTRAQAGKQAQGGRHMPDMRAQAFQTAAAPLAGLQQLDGLQQIAYGLQQTQRPPARAKPGGRRPLTVSWAGSGIYFWWQLGCVKYLMQHYDLSQVPMVGASGGALAAILAACNVDPELIFEEAHQLSIEHNIWERPMGLVGVWGSLIEKWLDKLLPADAAERCRGRVSIVVTAFTPLVEQRAISDFTSKQDLINVAMASAHVPIALDMKLTRSCRGMQCCDGSFPDFFSGENCNLLTDNRAVVFDYFDDPNLVRKGRMDMLELKDYHELQRLMQLGYFYAERLYQEGAFARFDHGPAHKATALLEMN